jgi:hypothetical protein
VEEIETNLVKNHQLLSRVLLLLVQRRKLDLLRRQRLVTNRPGRDLVQIVRSDGDEGTFAREVGVELVLEVDKGGVVELVELDVAEDRGGEVRADLGNFFLDVNGAFLTLYSTNRSLVQAERVGVTR